MQILNWWKSGVPFGISHIPLEVGNRCMLSGCRALLTDNSYLPLSWHTMFTNAFLAMHYVFEVINWLIDYWTLVVTNIVTSILLCLHARITFFTSSIFHVANSVTCCCNCYDFLLNFLEHYFFIWISLDNRFLIKINTFNVYNSYLFSIYFWQNEFER